MSNALEIATLGRLVETGLIRLASRNDHLLRRFETARWIEPTGRKSEWRVQSGASEALEEHLCKIAPTWRADFQFLRSIEQDPYDPRAIEALPALKRQKTAATMINRRNWNAAAGLGPKHEPQIASTTMLTKDWVLRFRPNKGLRVQFANSDVDLYAMASAMTECLIPERLWLRFGGFHGELPKLVMTCENLGAYIDLVIPDSAMAIYSPGSDIEAAAALIKHLPEAKWLHFGDIDPDGFQIAKNLAEVAGRQMNFFVPSFADEYLPGRPVETPWHNVPDCHLFQELRRTQKRIFQEVFMLDARLADEIAAHCLISQE